MYLSWDEQTITDFAEDTVEHMYEYGYVFTRLGKRIMHQTRSIRINLADFELSSENRRILRKTEEISLDVTSLPYADYHWSIGKMAKDFYETKFGEGVFSANKVKELLTDPEKSNFNKLFVYNDIGYAICYETPSMLHYSYPFYDLEKADKNMGMGMMVRAITYAKESGKQYCYLGSAQRPGDTYKMQFAGFEWFDGKMWQTDSDSLKTLL